MPTTTTTTFPGTDRAAERWTAGFTAAAAGLAAAVVLVAGGMAPHPGSSTATPAMTASISSASTPTTAAKEV